MLLQKARRELVFPLLYPQFFLLTSCTYLLILHFFPLRSFSVLPRCPFPIHSVLPHSLNLQTISCDPNLLFGFTRKAFLPKKRLETAVDQREEEITNVELNVEKTKNKRMAQRRRTCGYNSRGTNNTNCGLEAKNLSSLFLNGFMVLFSTTPGVR